MKKLSIAVLGLKGIPARGGAERVFESTIRYLYSNFNITIYCKKGYSNYSSPIDGINRIIIPSIKLKNLGVAIYFFLSAIHAYFYGKYNLLHIHNIDCAYILPILSIKYKNRILSTSHGSPYMRDKWSKTSKKFFRYMERLFFHYSDFITSVSMPLKEYYEKRYKRRVLYIPNGVNEEEKISSKFIDNYLMDKKITGNYVLFAAGRIIPTKGCHIFLQAVRKIGYNGTILIVGDISQNIRYTEGLKKLATPDTYFLGFINSKEELLGIIEKSKLFIFPSTYEAMSMTLLEVASLAVPIIASDIPENKAIFDSDEVLFFKSGNADSLAKKFRWSMGNYREMLEKARLAQIHTQCEYLWNKITKKYSGLYFRILKDNSMLIS